MGNKITSGNGWSFEPANIPQKKHPTGSLAPDKQDITMRLERRASGKIVTVLGGLVLAIKDREKLAHDLKCACGTGGTIHEGQIELQGDQREKARNWLTKNGWHVRH